MVGVYGSVREKMSGAALVLDRHPLSHAGIMRRAGPRTACNPTINID